ncbi:uncharacterized protein LOC117177346 [Belonocnema kinseyi]|uniref:uncharacterized protein LOC117177346 n=1 Tax=Belonocnema kinseyi TaxID=2817044 RepID=UPI00143DB002|nr:uncharacterized protein LOC117177346 [Belonocnema kinseyi]
MNQHELSDDEEKKSGSNSSLSSDEALSAEDFETSARAMGRTITVKVTKRDIALQKMLFAALEYSYQSENGFEKYLKGIVEIPDRYLRNARNMPEISPMAGFYLSEEKISYINLQSRKEGNVSDWKIIVRKVLLQIYGATIGHYAAKGTRGQQPAINRLLFKGLFARAYRASMENLNPKDFIKYINKCA